MVLKTTTVIQQLTKLLWYLGFLSVVIKILKL